jgi:GAF domain-containing protein
MRPLGQLTAESDRLRARIEAIERLAAESRVAAEAQREDEQRVEDELALFYALAEAVEALPERGPLLSTFFADLPRVMKVQRMLVLLFDQASREFEVVFESRSQPLPDGEVQTVPGDRIPWGAGLACAVVRRRAAVRTSSYLDACRLERVKPSPFAADLQHSIGVPLAAGNPVGVLVLWSGSRAFTRDDERLLRGVAPLLALAIGRAESAYTTQWATTAQRSEPMIQGSIRRSW